MYVCVRVRIYYTRSPYVFQFHWVLRLRDSRWLLILYAFSRRRPSTWSQCIRTHTHVHTKHTRNTQNRPPSARASQWRDGGKTRCLVDTGLFLALPFIILQMRIGQTRTRERQTCAAQCVLVSIYSATTRQRMLVFRPGLRDRNSEYSTYSTSAYPTYTNSMVVVTEWSRLFWLFYSFLNGTTENESEVQSAL